MNLSDTLLQVDGHLVHFTQESIYIGNRLSHPEIFRFQDVIKIKNKNNNFLIILKFSQHLFFFTGNLVKINNKLVVFLNLNEAVCLHSCSFALFYCLWFDLNLDSWSLNSNRICRIFFCKKENRKNLFGPNQQSGPFLFFFSPQSDPRRPSPASPTWSPTRTLPLTRKPRTLNSPYINTRAPPDLLRLPFLFPPDLRRLLPSLCPACSVPPSPCMRHAVRPLSCRSSHACCLPPALPAISALPTMHAACHLPPACCLLCCPPCVPGALPPTLPCVGSSADAPFLPAAWAPSASSQEQIDITSFQFQFLPLRFISTLGKQ